MKIKVYTVDIPFSRSAKRAGLALVCLAVLVGGAAIANANVAAFSAGQPLSAKALNDNFTDLEARSVPAGAVMHFNLTACPSGWAPLATAQGRYLVGLPAGGALGATIGSPLNDGENRPVGQHAHSATDSGHSHPASDSGHQHGMYPSGPPNQGIISPATQNANGVIDYPPYSMRTTVGFANITVGTGVANISVESAGTVPGTNAPYVELLVCQKN